MTEYYAKKFNEGLKFQDFATKQLYLIGMPIVAYVSKENQLKGENFAGIEIKQDDRLNETGNLYIETAEKTNVTNIEYIPSGIFRNDNTWLYCIGNYEALYLLSKQQLQFIYNSADNYFKHGIHKVETPTSRGILVPLEYAKRFLILKEIIVKK